MTDSFVPRLQLNTSRSTAFNGADNGDAAPRLNRTAAPGSGHANTTNSSSTSNNLYNNTSMTNNTWSSDWNQDRSGFGTGGGTTGIGAGGAPPSPAPRFGAFDRSVPPPPPPRFSDPLSDRGPAGPSARRPLFTSVSGSTPRDANVFAGDTGRVPLFDVPRNAGKAGLFDDTGPPRRGANGPARQPFRGETEFPSDGLVRDPHNFSAFAFSGPSHDFEARADKHSTNVFTRTYVGTSSGAAPSSWPASLSGVGVSNADWRGGPRTTAATTVSAAAFRTSRHGHDASRGGDGGDGGDDGWLSTEAPNGLVNSRSRARADRWTDEDPDGQTRLDDDDDDTMFNGNGTHLGSSTAKEDGESNDSASVSYASSTSYDGVHRSTRYRRRRGGNDGGDTSRKHRSRSRGRRRHSAVKDDNGDGEDSDDMWDAGEADPLSFADALVSAMDAQPVVPLDLLRVAQETPFLWVRHPSHLVVLSLLQHRGIYLPRYRELVDYHMAELFLHYVDLCREGAYFVYYEPSKWPKERFFRIRMLPVNRLEANTEPVPHLVITLHESGVHILDAIPLDNLVGVTVTPQAACFRPFLELPNAIIGCREGRGHRARLPVDGAFSLWFYDVQQRTSRSVDILTCDIKVFDIWTKTFRGLISVNSSSVVQVALTPQGESQELAGLTQAAQAQVEIDHGERKGKFAAN